MTSVTNWEDLILDNSIRFIMNDSWVQVPIMRAHAESINLEFEKPLSEEQALKLLADFPGVTVLDDRTANRCPRVLPPLVLFTHAGCNWLPYGFLPSLVQYCLVVSVAYRQFADVSGINALFCFFLP